MKKITLTSFALLFVMGCGDYYVGDEDYNLSLDEALSRLQERHSDNMYRNYEYFYDLKRLWAQAYQDDDKEIIEKEMLSFLMKQLDMHGLDHGGAILGYLENLRRDATCDEVKTKADIKYSELVQALRKLEREELERERQEQEQEEREQLEDLRAEFKKSREKLTNMSNGTLKNKSAQEVKKLVDEWRQESLSWELPREDYADFFAAETFYKIFGKPERKQLLSSSGLFGTIYSYLFYYNSKDGLVQIQVDADVLDDDGIVIIKELNIF